MTRKSRPHAKAFKWWMCTVLLLRLVPGFRLSVSESPFIRKDVEPGVFDSLQKSLSNLSVSQYKELKNTEFLDLENVMPLSDSEKTLFANMLAQLEKNWIKTGFIDFDRCYSLYSNVISRVFESFESREHCAETEDRVRKLVKFNRKEIKYVLGFNVDNCNRFKRGSILCEN